MRLPNFFIIGANKSGTTALYRYLRQHPEIFLSPRKEPNFFAHGEGDTAYPDIVTSLQEYMALFAGVAGETAIGEASTSYLHNPSSIERIRQRIPDARIVAVLRQPAERAYSNFVAAGRDGVESEPDFATALMQQESGFPDDWPAEYSRLHWGYKRLGFYFEPVRQYLQAFDREHIRIYLYDDFQSDPKAMLKDIFGFLRVDQGFVPDMSVRHNMSGIPRNRALHDWMNRAKFWVPAYKALVPQKLRQKIRYSMLRLNLQTASPIPEEARKTLNAEYREDILKLQDLIGRDLSHWVA